MKLLFNWLSFVVFGVTMLCTQSTNAGNWNTGGGTPRFIPQTDPGGKAVNYGNSYFVA